MVKLNCIYTRTGDDGTTGLVTGERRLKSDLRFEACGSIDEVNCSIGLARAHADLPLIDRQLSLIQNDLFDLGADIATPTPQAGEDRALRIHSSQVARLETDIDAFVEELQPLRSFILPGGTPFAAHLHQIRAITRRTERIIVALKFEALEPVSDIVVQYVNRLSDYMFVAARYANEKGQADVLWIPAANRTNA